MAASCCSSERCKQWPLTAFCQEPWQSAHLRASPLPTGRRVAAQGDQEKRLIVMNGICHSDGVASARATRAGAGDGRLKGICRDFLRFRHRPWLGKHHTIDFVQIRSVAQHLLVNTVAIPA